MSKNDNKKEAPQSTGQGRKGDIQPWPDGHVLLGKIDSDGRLTPLNWAWEPALGYPSEEIAGRLLQELMPLERRIADDLVGQLHAAAEHSVPLAITLLSNDGRRKQFLWYRRLDTHDNQTYIAGEETGRSGE